MRACSRIATRQINKYSVKSNSQSRKLAHVVIVKVLEKAGRIGKIKTIGRDAKQVKWGRTTPNLRYCHQSYIHTTITSTTNWNLTAHKNPSIYLHLPSSSIHWFVLFFSIFLLLFPFIHALLLLCFWVSLRFYYFSIIILYITLNSSCFCVQFNWVEFCFSCLWRLWIGVYLFYLFIYLMCFSSVHLGWFEFLP